ncbi:MAG: hypothetical protein ABL966_01535 [Acidimicrobiales bacterium]
MRPRTHLPRPRARAACLVVLVGLAGSPALTTSRAVAETPTAAAPVVAAPAVLAPPSPDLPGLPATSIELAQVPVESPEFERASARYQEVDASHAAARTARFELDHTVSVLQQHVRELDASRVAAQARIAGLTARVEVVEAAIQELAVASFVSGDADERLNSALASETPAISEVERRDVLGGVSMEVLLTERAAYRARIDEAGEQADEAVDGLADARKALQDLRADRPAALIEETATGADVAVERVAYEEARVLATVEGVEFPLVALDAYYRAAGSIAEELPQCKVRWWAIAGISRVEGRHGTYGGTELQANGDTTRRIIGIQLNGTNETAVVGDSDGGTLDGDPSFDRAVGPMQFIPQTWSRYQADGNDDGTNSPFNLYDATLAAAKYLCTSSSGLDADPGLRAAYFSYNQSVPYVDSVLSYARLYERSIDVPDPVDVDA